MKKLAFTCVAICLVLTVGSAYSKDIYVSPGGDDLTGDGTFLNPYATLQKGIDEAVSYDRVIAKAGTYMGDGNRDIDFRGKPIEVTSMSGAAQTKIDCEGTDIEPHRGFYFHTAEEEDSILSEFTITNGYADLGGGIYCSLASPTIEDNIITSNKAASHGGGLAYSNCPDVIIQRNEITYNEVMAGGGGGIYCAGSDATIQDNTITNNTASSGGGIFISGSFFNGQEILDNVITDNTSRKEDGGGIYCNGSALTIERNTISYNSARLYGGGIHLLSSSVAMRDNEVTYNGSSISVGGGISFWSSAGEIYNNRINNNSAGYVGGGIYLDSFAGEIRDNEIILNTASSGGGGILVSVGSSPAIQGNVITHNTLYGILIYSGTNPDLGGGDQITYGRNEIHSNVGADILTNETIKAEYNWWGQESVNQETPVGLPDNVDYDPWLPGPPDAPSIAVYTNKSSYSKGETVTVYLRLVNVADRPYWLKLRLGFEKEGGSSDLADLPITLAPRSDEIVDFGFTIQKAPLLKPVSAAVSGCLILRSEEVDCGKGIFQIESRWLAED